MTNSGILSEPVLVGREDELEELQHYLDLAIQGQGKIVFVSGEAGSGKTKLVTDFLNSAKQKTTVTTLKGWCLSDAGIPYFPFIEAFSNYFSSINKEKSVLNPENNLENEESEVNIWLKGPIRRGLSGIVEFSPETWKDLTFASVRRALIAISAKSPTVLFIDDLHWADSASLALLHYISRTLSSQRLLVLATFRKEDLKEDDNGHPHPLVEALRLMSRDSLFQEVKLSGLNGTGVKLLAEHMVGGRVQSSLAEKLENDSAGNPLFVVESLRMLAEKQCLVINKDLWCLSTNEIGVPTKIKDIILNRVNRLKPLEKKVLDVASVVGSKFVPELLASVLGMDSLHVIETLDGISQTSSLVSCEGSYYRFDHVKSRDAVYEEISTALKKAYHSKIAERLEANSTSNQKSDLAHHFARAGDKSKAVKYSLAAGAEALSFVLGTEAIKHFKYVVDSTVDDPEFVIQREIAMEGLGDGLYANSNGEAVNVFEQLSASTNSGVVRARALRKAARAAAVQGNYVHALDLVKTPISDISGDRLESARFQGVKGMVETWGAYITEGKHDLEEALKIFEEEYSLLDMIDVLTQLPIAYIMEKAADNPSSFEHPDKALASILRALALCDYTKALSKATDANAIAFIVFSKCALPKEAAKIAKASFETLERINDQKTRDSNAPWSYWMQSFLAEIDGMDKIFSQLPLDSMKNFGTRSKIKFYMSSLFSGALTEFRGSVKTAIEHGQKGAQYAEETDFFNILTLNYANLTRQYSELGQMEQAQMYCDKMDKIFDETTLSAFMFAHAIHLFSKGVFFTSKHQYNEANKYFEDTIKYYLSVSPSTGIMASIRRGYCWSLLQQGKFEEAKKQFEESKKTLDELESRLVHSNIMAYFLAPASVQVGEEFNLRLDLINVAKNAAVLAEVKQLLPASFKVISTKPILDPNGSALMVNGKRVLPFHDDTITLKVQALQTGAFTIAPTIVYIDELGERKTAQVNPVTINVSSFEVPQGISESEIDILRKFGLNRSA